MLTAIASLYAYVWLLFVLQWNSPTVVELWEAILTFLHFPILVFAAYATDNGWWRHKWVKSAKVTDESCAKKEDEPVSDDDDNRVKCQKSSA